MYYNLLTSLILSTSIIFGDFSFCDTFWGRHYITIQDDIISENRIEICNNADDIVFIVLHELWHQFWHIYLSIQERNEYRALQSDYVHDYYRYYSMTNAWEDFADIFALIILNRKSNKSELFYEKKDFILKMINK